MAKIHSQQLPFDLAEHQFIEVHHLDDAIGSLQEGGTDYFYWEHWMTLRFVHEKKIRQIGNFQAPWSGFLVAGQHAKRRLIRMGPSLAMSGGVVVVKRGRGGETEEQERV